MSWSDLTGADWAAPAVAAPHTTRAETAACRNRVYSMAGIVDRVAREGNRRRCLHGCVRDAAWYRRRGAAPPVENPCTHRRAGGVPRRDIRGRRRVPEGMALRDQC